MRLRTTHGPAGAENTKDGIIFSDQRDETWDFLAHEVVSIVLSVCAGVV